MKFIFYIIYGFKNIKKNIIANNQDVIVCFRIIIYSKKQYIYKTKFFRYVILVKLFLLKNVFKKDLFTLKLLKETNPCILRESKLSKRRMIRILAKELIKCEVIFFDVFNFLLLEYKISKEKKYYKVNYYAKLLYDILSENQKDIILINNKNNSNAELHQLLADNDITKYKDILASEIDNLSKHEILKKFENQQNYSVLGYVKTDLDINFFDSEKEWKIFNYFDCNFFGNYFRPQKINTINQKIYNLLLNEKMHNGMKVFSYEYEFGYNYGGIITYYIISEMKKNNTSFLDEKSKLFNRLKIDNNIIDKKTIELLLDLIFPFWVNNLAYDGSEKKYHEIYLEKNYIQKQKKIQQGINAFILDYSELLVILQQTTYTEYKDIEEIIKFVIKDPHYVKNIIAKRLLVN